MTTKVLVPLLGEGVEEVTVTKWLKSVGDTINELEPLLEVNTDKVDTEIPAPASGVVLKIEMQEGTVAKVGEVLAFIGKPGEALEGAAAPEPMGEAAKTSDIRPEPAYSPLTDSKLKSEGKSLTSRELGFISPVVARIAAEHGLDLGQIPGTGLHGRITKKDVLNFIESGQQSAVSPQPAQSSSVTPDTGTRDTLLKHSTIRRQIADHMLMSKRTSPHVLTVMEADMSRVVAHRAANKANYAREGVNLTYTAYFMQAITAGLKAYPVANSSWTEEGLLIHSDINIGMATSLGEAGLIVPVIKGADSLSLLGMARAVNDLADRARSKKLKTDDVKDGTFTLTNHGVSGSLFALPIINQPQCGILGVGAMRKRAVVVTDSEGSDSIAIRPMVYLSFVFDHRILDGASADWFLMKVKETLENWA
jgi:pyruvate/2-oxoglutarate dehydrogenase complex dihydrolipoamide acyltransferase (E2) component